MALGMLDPGRAQRSKEAGLDYYNHNIDTSERYCGEVISTRTFADRLEMLANVRDSGIKVCCGGIVGMGEEAIDRIDMLLTLANLPEQPESVPINMLIPIEGTPLAAPSFGLTRSAMPVRLLHDPAYRVHRAGRIIPHKAIQAPGFFPVRGTPAI